MFIASFEALFFDMVECCGQEFSYVMVGDGIVNVLSAPLFGEQSRPVELLKSLRNGGDLFIEFLRQLRDTVLLIQQSLHQLKSLG